MQTPPTLRAFDDTAALRNAVFDSIKTTASNLQPVQNQRYTLSISDVDWGDDPQYNSDDVYNARLKQQSLTRKLVGTWNLHDTQTGKLLQKSKKTIANVPYFLEDGSIMSNGVRFYTRNQSRLKSGIYTRMKENGELVSNVNTAAHEGPTHSYHYDPKTGKFNMEVSKNNVPLYTFLNAMGATDEELEAAWGKKVLEVNKAHAKDMNMRKLYDRFVRKKYHQPGDKDSDELMRQRIQEQAKAIKFAREVSKATLGIDSPDFDKNSVIAATNKLLKLSRGEVESDSRDNMAFQSFYGPEDLFAERLRLDDGRVRRQLLNKLTFLSKNNPDLSKIPSGHLTKQINSVITNSGLASPAEEVTPYEQYSKLFSVTRMGSGGIGSTEAVPDSAREVNNSQYGFIDPLQTPESLRAGVDLYISSSARKGSDNNLYIPVVNAKTGKQEYKSAVDLMSSVVTLQSEWDSGEPRIAAFDTDRQPRMGIKREAVEYIFPNQQSAFNNLSNLIPMMGSVKGQRVAMAARMLTQALPIEAAESPLVQSRVPGTEDESYEDRVGRFSTVNSKENGVVRKVTDREIIVDTDSGQKRYPLMVNSPSNRKTLTNQTPLVQPGQTIKAGQVLAKSNYTDDTGALAQGLNARAVVMPWRGGNTMDAITVSQSFADRLKSQHAYQHKVDWSDNIKHGKKTFIGAFPSIYDKDQLDTIDDNGIVKIGTKVNQGDPLILKADVNTKPVDRIHRKGAQSLMNSALEWDNQDPGVVVDVHNDKNGVNVIVSSLRRAQLSDKLSNRYGAKGVIGEIVPDDQMPITPDGPAEIIYSPQGNISRTNYSMIHEHVLGRIAKKLGRPIKIESFDPKNPDMAEYVMKLAKEHGINPREPIIDPDTGKQIKGTDGAGVGYGLSYVQKLHHSGEDKLSERSFGGYTADEQPGEHSKRVALMSTNALISHGAINMLADARRVRGQKNDQYWAGFMRGYQPPEPEQPAMYHKFISHLQGSGIHVTPQAGKLKILALTNNDVKELAGNREVSNSETIKWEGDKKGIKGGLFDPAIFGEYGDRWGYIKPVQPVLNPVMEEPARRMLGLTQAKLENVIAGREEFGVHGTGPQAIRKALGALNVDQEMLKARNVITNSRGVARDEAVKKLQFLKSAKDNNLTPADWMLDRIPVLPSKFRPANEMSGSKTMLIADVNYLYKQFIDHNDSVKELEQQIGDAGEEYLQSYNYFKQITGLMDPTHPKLQQKRVSGLLKKVFGESAKYGMVQRSLLGGAVDVVGRGNIVVDANMDMDEVGLPMNAAYEVYKPVVMRKLVQSGVPLMQAQEFFDRKDRRAKQALLQATKERPVVVDRAPLLHRGNILAFWPKLVRGDAIKVNQYMLGPMAGDLDGDNMNFQVPISDGAVEDAKRLMLPSQNLLSPLDRSPVFAPMEDYQQGLYAATSPRKKKGRTKVFATMEDMKRAYRAGDLEVWDDVEILKK